jgi:hypothetical protein
MIARATAGLLAVACLRAGLRERVVTVLSLQYDEGRNGGMLRF